MPNVMIGVPILLLFVAAASLCGLAQVGGALVVIGAFALLFVGLPQAWRSACRVLTRSAGGGQAAGITRTGLPAR